MDWFSEELPGQWRQSLPITQKLVDQRSPFQHIQVFDTKDFGRMLVLDGKVQCSERDEFTYHEMLAHVPLLTHPHPHNVLVVGGGDGGTVREVLKHPSVSKVTLVEIDEQVIEVSRQWLPTMSSGLAASPRLEIITKDAAEAIRSLPKQDVILVDSSDPEGPSEVLFGQAFFDSLKEALHPDGVLALQAGSPLFYARQISDARAKLEKMFRYVRPYLVPVILYPGGAWLLISASDRYDPGMVPDSHSLQVRYYCPEIHRASMARCEF
jgi:spermidine synthase